MPLEVAAAALVAEDRARAYSEARRRERQASSPRAAARWGEVARIVTRLTGPGVGDPSTRTAIDADGRAPSRLAPCFPEVDQVGELERILAARPQSFRLQFFGVATERGPTILSECELRAADATSAIRAAADAAWPPQAIGLRIVDAEGREIFERLRADR